MDEATERVNAAGSILRPHVLVTWPTNLRSDPMSRRPSEVLRENRELIRTVAMRHRTENLRVFGSASRGEDDETSDLDLLVDPLPGATLLDLGAIQIELEDSLGISVDVLTPGDLPKKFRDQVLSEAVPI